MRDIISDDVYENEFVKKKKGYIIEIIKEIKQKN